MVWGLRMGHARSPTCIALFTDSLMSCEFLGKLYMPPHPHCGGFNMEPCMACGEKRLSHNQADAEKLCNRKKQPPPLAVLWQF